ncbi:MAG: hypothetical protein HY926_15535 [Elusimicrobia bacterium]|nr:hypothetical protein [Elusimicrobiota bacterium]
MPTEFSETLARLRKAADFPSAYAFYHDNGGKDIFRLSYRKYQLIEKGRNLPRPERLPLLISLLRHSPGNSEANSLVLSWLRTYVGSEVFDSLVAPLLSPHLHSVKPTPTREVMSRALRGKRTSTTPKQYALIAKSFAHYWAHTILTDAAEGCTAEELARCAKVPLAQARKAFKDLCKGGLIQEIRKGVFRLADFGKVHVSPPLSVAPALRKKTAGYVKRMAERGQICAGRRLIIHADEAEFGQFYSFFLDSIRSAQAYIDPEKSSRSAYFMVEGRIVKLFPF